MVASKNLSSRIVVALIHFIAGFASGSSLVRLAGFSFWDETLRFVPGEYLGMQRGIYGVFTPKTLPRKRKGASIHQTWSHDFERSVLAEKEGSPHPWAVAGDLRAVDKIKNRS